MIEQAKNVEMIFLAALARPTAQERLAYVEGACAGEPDVLERMRELLASHEERDGPLDARPPGFVELVMPSPSTESPGTVIGGYKLLQQIGEGGMGTVWMAEQRQPVQRKVAIKIIKPGMDSKQVIARFEAERQALAVMDHPQIAKVFDAGTTSEGRPYFVMELVKGQPITKYCDEHCLTPRRRLELLVAVCQAIQHAHQKGIIHRDIKPSNVMVAPYDGRPVVKVIDFGVAKATGQQLTERTLFTEFGAVLGTVEYMSPEQAELNNQDVDTRSDIYSLGVLLYELLTGTTPLRRERLKQAAFTEMLRMIREEEPPKPSTRLSESTGSLPSISAQRQTEPAKLTRVVRGELDWIVMKCLEKDRSRRYETANGLAMDLERYLRDEPVRACPPSAWYRLRKFARRNKAILTTAALIAALLLVATVVSSWLAIEAREAEGLAQTRLEREKSERERAVRAERKGKERLYQAKFAEAEASRHSRQVGQRFESWKAVAEAAALARDLGLGEPHTEKLRDQAIACLALTDLRRVKGPWKASPTGGSWHVEFDPDFKHYARLDPKGVLTIHRVDDDQELARRSDTGNLTFSPNGAYLAIQRQSSLLVWDWQRDESVWETSFRVEDYDVAFSPDNRLVAAGQRDGTLTFYDLTSRKETKRVDLGVSPMHLAFHPGGASLAVSTRAGAGQVQVRDVPTGGLIRQLPHPKDLWRLAWHQGGDLVAAGCDDRQVYVWDTAAARVVNVLQGHQDPPQRVGFAAGGDVVVSWAWDDTTRLWNPWTGQELLRVAGTGSQVSRDGRLLATQAGRKITLWEVTPAREYRTLPRTPAAGGEGYEGGDVSPDGRWLALGTGHGLRLWDLARGQELAHLQVGRITDARFDPSGEALFTCGAAGLYRWPVQAGAGLLRIGPPHKLPVTGQMQRIGLDKKGRTLAVSDWQTGVRVLDLKNPAAPARLFDHPGANWADVSPDGDWIASSTHHGFGNKVWSVKTEQAVDLIPDNRQATLTFSPDGRWVAAGTNTEVGLWSVGSWKLAREIRSDHGADSPPRTAFSRDGKVLAIALSPSTVQLVDPSTGRRLARLQAADTDPVSLLVFNSDGSELVASAAVGNVRVWDLRRIREQLKEIELDWDPLPYPPASAGEAHPVKVEVDLGEYGKPDPAQVHFERGQAYAADKRWQEAVAEYSRAIDLQPDHASAWEHRSRAYRRLGEWDKAVSDMEQAVQAGPDDARLLNNLAWILTTCPSELRDATRALPLAQRAVELAPKKGTYWNTLGVVHYRCGQWRKAIDALEKSMDLQKGGDSRDFFFLALAHWRLSNKEQAQRWHDEATRWMSANRPDDEELARFRAEAAELLGKNRKD